jgi:repressor LexA
MFNKEKFAQIIKKILDQYESGVEFSEKSGVNRTYISKYINMSLDKAPSPAILKKLANHSKGITTYEELMETCGYVEIDFSNYKFLDDDLINSYKQIGMDTTAFINLNKLFNEICREFTQEELDLFSKILKDRVIYNNKGNKDAFDFNPYLIGVNDASKAKITHGYKIFLNADLKIYEDITNYLKSLINSDDALDKDDVIMPLKIPVVGKISAGRPILAEENFQGYEFAPSTNIKKGYEYFYLRVSGDSMNIKFDDGDSVLVQKQENLENGEIGVVRVNGYDATVKKFKRQGDFIILEPMSTNPHHEIQIYKSTDDVHIIGKVISYMGKIN